MTGMNDPKTIVVNMMHAKVVVIKRPLSLKNPVSFLPTSGILRTRPKEIAPLVRPPYEMKPISDAVMTDFFFEHNLGSI